MLDDDKDDSVYGELTILEDLQLDFKDKFRIDMHLQSTYTVYKSHLMTSLYLYNGCNVVIFQLNVEIMYINYFLRHINDT